jgi:hypothetical protein
MPVVTTAAKLCTAGGIAAPERRKETDSDEDIEAGRELGDAQS